MYSCYNAKDIFDNGVHTMQIDKNYIAERYHELHQVPEIGFELPKSLAIIRRELDAMGVTYTEEIGKSCIIATLNEGIGNKVIALRADFDALPITEETGLPYSSTHPGKMHACGHDAHAAMLLGTIKALKAMEKDIQCCVKFIFQSAEEILGGAKSICDDGFMDQVDVILGCHIAPTQPAGTIRLCQGCSNASSRGFKIRLHGKSCHGAAPQNGVDAIAMAVNVYNNIQLMRTRQISPLKPILIGVGEIHGGTANNIVAGDCELNCTLRTLDNETDQFAYSRIEKIAKHTAEDMGGTAEVETYKYSPCLMNDSVVAADLAISAAKVVGKDAVDANKPVEMGAEDFAYYTLHKPGVMFSLGVRPESGVSIPVHNGKMTLNEDAFDIGPKVFIQYILDNMEK